ncbi:hypothetical protein BC835DRAFT_1273502, partial [Cytidiella melzeri]
VLNAIGPLLFRGIVSDNTGNTRLARAIVSKTFPWVMNLIDAPHHFQLMLKDIGGLHYFKEIIECCRQTIRFFRKSSYANAHLREKRKDLKIKTGLTSFGKTRFSTVYLSGCSLRTNMPAIKALCNANTVNLKVRVRNNELLLILAPGAKSTMCLESTNSTVSDVYVFWLATLAELHDIITDRHNPMPNEVREDIRRIANFRWKGMIEQSPTADVYHAGFILDPRKCLLSYLELLEFYSSKSVLGNPGYRKSDILCHANANPLAIAPIRVNSSRQAPVATTNLPDPVRRAGQFLLDRLRIEYNDRKTPICGWREDEAVDLLKDQIGKYYRSEPPFNRPVTGDEGPREWWERLNQDRSYISQPIAVCILMALSLRRNCN